VTIRHSEALQERADEMVRLKPHIPPDQAQAAIAEVDAIITEVREKGLVPQAGTAGSA